MKAIVFQMMDWVRAVGKSELKKMYFCYNDIVQIHVFFLSLPLLQRRNFNPCAWQIDMITHVIQVWQGSFRLNEIMAPGQVNLPHARIMMAPSQER